MKELQRLGVINKICAVFHWFVSLVGVYLIYPSMAPVRDMTLGQTYLSATEVMLGLLGCLLLVGLGVVHWLLSTKVVSGQWKNVQIGASVLGLFNVPLGTCAGVFMLWMCLRNENAMSAYEEERQLLL